MQNLNEKKILGTVPKKLQLVETFWDCPEFSRNKQNQKGITLIALIITIIVMLILVGVTINVALNGGLFEKGEKAAFQTEASTVKEQLEMAKALKVMNADGKPVDDYSDITVGNLEGLDDETKTKYANILVVAKNGDICYNSASVTDKEKTWLEEIGIKAYVNTGGSEPGEFTWAKFDLNVDTSANYEFAPSEDYVLVMNFTDDGILTVKNKGTNELMLTVDTKEKEAGVLRIEFGGTTSSLTMENGTENILATPDDGDPVVYVKNTAGDETEPPVEEAKDKVYAASGYSAHYILTAEGKIVFAYGGQIINEYAKYEIYEGTPESLLNKYTQYEGYTITDKAKQFGEFVIAYSSSEGTTTEGELIGAFKEDILYVASAVNDSDGKTIEIGDAFQLDSSLTLEDVLP